MYSEVTAPKYPLSNKVLLPLSVHWLDFRRGIIAALPICICYITCGLSIGIVAKSYGVSFSLNFLRSLFVYSGSSESIGQELLIRGIPTVAILLTAGAMSARYFLMNATIAPHLCRFTLLQKILVAIGVTDETFVLHMAKLESGNKANLPFIFGVNIAAHASWILGGMLGFILAKGLGDTNAFGLDFAIVAMFIAILALKFHGRFELLSIFLSIVFYAILNLLDLHSVAILLTAIFVSAIMTGVQVWKGL